MRWPFMTTCRVPRDLAAVTTIRTDTEVDPRSVGVSRAGVTAVWQAVERLYQSGIHPALQLCVRRRGEVLIDRAIGYASGNGPDDPRDAKKVRVTTDTPFNIYSASKAYRVASGVFRGRLGERATSDSWRFCQLGR